MSNSKSRFRFQRFSVNDDQCGMKIGTDGVLLGAWSDVAGCQRLLDIGTGCGLIALMLAQRTELSSSKVNAIDIEGDAVEQANANFSDSPWPDRISAQHCSLAEYLQKLDGKSFDHCVCNPPYFENSWPSENPRKQVARHVGALTRESLFRCSHRLLGTKGKLSLILPAEQQESTIDLASTHGFFLARQTLVRPMPDKPFKRVLFEFSIEEVKPVFDELTVEIERHHFSSAYESLTREFHLRYSKS